MHKISTWVVCVNGKHTESFFCSPVRAKRTREENADTRVTDGTRRERILQRAYYPTNNEEHWVKFKIPQYSLISHWVVLHINPTYAISYLGFARFARSMHQHLENLSERHMQFA